MPIGFTLSITTHGPDGTIVYDDLSLPAAKPVIKHVRAAQADNYRRTIITLLTGEIPPAATDNPRRFDVPLGESPAFQGGEFSFRDAAMIGMLVDQIAAGLQIEALRPFTRPDLLDEAIKRSSNGHSPHANGHAEGVQNG